MRRALQTAQFSLSLLLYRLVPTLLHIIMPSEEVGYGVRDKEHSLIYIRKLVFQVRVYKLKKPMRTQDGEVRGGGRG